MSRTENKNSIVLIFDDDEASVVFVKRLLSEHGFRCRNVVDAAEAKAFLQHHSVDMVMVNIPSDDSSLRDVVDGLGRQCPGVPVIVTAAKENQKAALRCLQDGAYDFLLKPFTEDELVFCTRRALERRTMLNEVNRLQRNLKEDLQEQAGRIKASVFNTIRTMVFALEAKDAGTSGHSQKVADISVEIAKEMHLPPESIDNIALAGLIHDIGKIGITESILNNREALTEEEKQQVQQHPDIGVRIMGPVIDDEEILLSIRHHHECFDGSGYPDRLKGYQIPLGARIITVADAFEAMTAERPYRQAVSREDACRELIRCKLTQFDPEVVDAFLRYIKTKEPTL
jgi:response regulator RpfG family c-di-GMP phosphodiesterase